MLKDFKSFVFVSVDVKGVADAFSVSVDVKGLSAESFPKHAKSPGDEDGQGRVPTQAEACATRATLPLPLFWKCVKRKGFKSFVLKVCETKGFADAFLRKCVKLNGLGSIFGSLELFNS